MRVLMAILACCLLMTPGQASAQLAPQGQVISSITKEQLASILKDAGYSAEIDKDGDLAVKVSGTNAWVSFGSPGSFTFLVFFVDKPPLENFNKWNDKYFTKAVRTPDGTIRMEWNMIIAGGVTSQNIIANLNTFAGELGKAIELVE